MRASLLLIFFSFLVIGCTYDVVENTHSFTDNVNVSGNLSVGDILFCGSSSGCFSYLYGLNNVWLGNNTFLGDVVVSNAEIVDINKSLVVRNIDNSLHTNITGGATSETGSSFFYSDFDVQATNPSLRVTGTDANSAPNIQFINDVQNWRVGFFNAGSGDYFYIRDITNTKNPFIIENNAPSNSFYMNNAGRIGIGTNTPDANAQLHLKTTSASSTNQLMLSSSASQVAQSFYDDSDNDEWIIRFVRGSDKFDIRDATNGIDMISIIKNGDITMNGDSTGGRRTNLQIQAQSDQWLRLESEKDGEGARIIANRDLSIISNLNRNIDIQADNITMVGQFKVQASDNASIYMCLNITSNGDVGAYQC